MKGKTTMRKKVIKKSATNLNDIHEKLSIMEDMNKLLEEPDPDSTIRFISWYGGYGKDVTLPESWYDEVFALIQTLAQKEKQKLSRQLNKHLKVKIPTKNTT